MSAAFSRARGLLWLLALMAACSADVSSPTPPGIDETAVLVGTGDIAVCGSGGAIATGRLVEGQPGTVIAVGDLAYQNGTAEEFQNCYDPTWGRHKDRTRPTPGNHEYGSGTAAPYFAYFGANAGPPGLGYYRYRSGAWQVFSLNSNMESPHRASQIPWLRSELAVQQSLCSVAYFHHPLFSSGQHGVMGPPPVVRDLWVELYDAGTDVVISAHEHFYERFAPQTPEGRADSEYGIRQFVVGTGGAPLHKAVRRVPNSEALLTTNFGILRLTLEPRSYRWEFMAVEGGAVLDSGTGTCHSRTPR